MRELARSFRWEFVWLLLLVVVLTAFRPIHEISTDERYEDEVSYCDEPPDGC